MKDKLTEREKKWEKAVGEGERQKKKKNRKEEDGQAAVGGEKKQEGK